MAQIAITVILVIDMNAPKQQAINPFELLFTQIAATAQEQAGKEESEVDDYDRTENAAD